MNKKREYISPELVIYGDVEKLTESGGGGFADTPIGTPIGDVTAGS